MNENDKKDSLTPDDVEAVNNLDTARMSLRWALERIRSLELETQPLIAELRDSKLKGREELRRARQEFEDRLRVAEENARWLAEALERETARRRLSEQNGQSAEKELESLFNRCAALEIQVRELSQQNQQKQAQLASLVGSLERDKKLLLDELEQWKRRESEHLPRLLELERRLRETQESAARAAQGLAQETERRRQLEGERAISERSRSALEAGGDFEAGLREAAQKQAELQKVIGRLQREKKELQVAYDRLWAERRESAAGGAEELPAETERRGALEARLEESRAREARLDDALGALKREKRALEEELDRRRLARSEAASPSVELEERCKALGERVEELEGRIREGRKTQADLEVRNAALTREKAALSEEAGFWKSKAVEGTPADVSASREKIEAEARKKYAALEEEMKRREATLLDQKRKAEEMGDFLAQEFERKRAEVEKLKAEFLQGMAKAMERYGGEEAS